jgi:hypothetical protein
MRRWRRAGVAAAAIAVVLLQSQAAYASTSLADGAVVNTNAATADYTFNTTSYYWSVVALSTTVDYDLRLYDSNGTPLGSSTYGTGVTDFVAINSNLRPLGSYRATVNHFAGTGSYYVLASGPHRHDPAAACKRRCQRPRVAPTWHSRASAAPT